MDECDLGPASQTRRLPHSLVTSGPELRAAWAQLLYTLGGYMSPMSNQLRLGVGGP